jgi:hypothetical protein
MKRFLLISFFLLGLFAMSCAPPDVSRKADFKTVYADLHQVQAPVIMTAADDASLPAPDTPVKWVDENLDNMIVGIVFSIYEFLALKIPTSKTISVIGNLYKLLTFFFPDKSKGGGTFDIRDKL